MAGRNISQSLGKKYGIGVDTRARIGRPAHGSMSQMVITVMASSAVISASALTLSPTV